MSLTTLEQMAMLDGDEYLRFADVRKIAALADAEIAALRSQLARELETNAALRRDLTNPPPDVQEAALKRCGHFEIVDRLRAECNQWREELRIYRETESADTERLDWLLRWLADPVNCRNIRFDRAMIDAEIWARHD
jgi:hypothetical protein